MAYVWRHQAITKTHVGLQSTGSSDTRPRVMFTLMLKIAVP